MSSDGASVVDRADWRSLAGASAALFLVAVATHWRSLWLDGALGDERMFLAAWQAIARGASPYGASVFNYPPPFAFGGHRLWETLGEHRTLVLLRLLALAGAGVVAAVATRPWLRPRPARWAGGLAIVALASPIGAALGLGNIAPAVQGGALAALVLAPSLPLVAGFLLGAGIVCKPLMAACLPLLLAGPFTAPRDAEVTRDWRSLLRSWQWLTAASAGLVATVLLLACGVAATAEMLRLASVPAPSSHDLALTKIARSFGLTLPAGVVFVAVTAIAVLAAWRLRPSARGFLALATTASVLSLPIIWPHTLAITFPTQCLALEKVFAERRAAAARSVWRTALPLLVVAAMLSIEGSAGGGGAPADWPPALAGLVAAIPLAALVFLCACVLWERRAA